MPRFSANGIRYRSRPGAAGSSRRRASKKQRRGCWLRRAGHLPEKTGRLPILPAQVSPLSEGSDAHWGSLHSRLKGTLMKESGLCHGKGCDPDAHAPGNTASGSALWQSAQDEARLVQSGLHGAGWLRPNGRSRSFQSRQEAGPPHAPAPFLAMRCVESDVHPSATGPRSVPRSLIAIRPGPSGKRVKARGCESRANGMQRDLGWGCDSS